MTVFFFFFCVCGDEFDCGQEDIRSDWQGLNQAPSEPPDWIQN